VAVLTSTGRPKHYVSSLHRVASTSGRSPHLARLTAQRRCSQSKATQPAGDAWVVQAASTRTSLARTWMGTTSLASAASSFFGARSLVGARWRETGPIRREVRQRLLRPNSFPARTTVRASWVTSIASTPAGLWVRRTCIKRARSLRASEPHAETALRRAVDGPLVAAVSLGERRSQ
jgi:hypothetical protein